MSGMARGLWLSESARIPRVVRQQQSRVDADLESRDEGPSGAVGTRRREAETSPSRSCRRRGPAHPRAGGLRSETPEGYAPRCFRKGFPGSGTSVCSKHPEQIRIVADIARWHEQEHGPHMVQIFTVAGPLPTSTPLLRCFLFRVIAPCGRINLSGKSRPPSASLPQCAVFVWVVESSRSCPPHGGQIPGRA
jgi:hypothetical protein